MSANVQRQRKNQRPLCSIKGCAWPHAAQGWCRRHYMRWYAHGDPDAGRALDLDAPSDWLAGEAIRERRRHLKRTYGITVEDYDAMLTAQGGVCAICEGPQAKAYLYFDIDHNKETGAVRGLLCRHCNTRLSALESDFHARGMAYLRRHRR